MKIKAKDKFVTGIFSYTRHEAFYNLRSPLNDVYRQATWSWISDKKSLIKMTGDFWYYDKLDFDLKFSNASFFVHLFDTYPVGWVWERGRGLGLGTAWEVSWLVPRAQSSLVIYAVTHSSRKADTIFRRRKRKEKTPLVLSSYLSRAHFKAEDSGFLSKNFPDTKSRLPFIHGAIKTYILKILVSSGSL